MARPSSYTEEIGNKICFLLSEGISLRKICQSEEMPDDSSVYRWAIEIPEFYDKYHRARQSQMLRFAEELADISEETPEAVITTNGIERRSLDPAGVNRNKLRVDTRKWLLSKLLPKTYGDKLDLEHSGQVTVKRVVTDL